MIQVGIVGFGTIGKRLADAVDRQPDMVVAGVAKRSQDHAAMLANRRGYPLFSTDGEETLSTGTATIAGDVADLVEACDVVVDATPAGYGAQNRQLYEMNGTPAIYQGGEDAAIAETSFVAEANYGDARNANSTRVVSCNTTGLTRLLGPLDDQFGVERAQVTLVRRGGDPAQPDRGPIDDIVPDPVTIPSHHGPDLGTVLPDVPITTMAMKVPTTVMHLHAVQIRLERDVHESTIRELLADRQRVVVVPGEASIAGCAGLRELARDAGRPRGDLPENGIWDESITVDGRNLYCFQGIHQESIVVPENVDAIRALDGDTDAETSMERTNSTLELGLDLADRKVPA